MITTERLLESAIDLPERRRLAELPSDPLLSDIVALASALCGVPIAAVNLLTDDRQVSKAVTGVRDDQFNVPIELALCRLTAEGVEPLEIHDVARDERFTDHPLVVGEPHLRFYAGAPLIARSGAALGALCVMSPHPHRLAAEQRRILQQLARLAIGVLESAAVRSEQQGFFDLSAEMFAILHPNGRVLRANHCLAEALGVSIDDLQGQRLHRHVELSDHQRLDRTLARCAAGTPIDEDPIGFFHRSGERRVLKLRWRRGEYDRIHLIGHDVTDEQRVQARLRLLEQAVASSRNPIIVADVRSVPGGVIDYVNPAFEEVTGYSAAEATGRNCNFLQAHDRAQPAVAEIVRAMAEREACNVTMRNYRKDGALFYNNLRLSPVPDSSGEVTHYVGMQYDVTELRRQQERIERLDRIRAFVTTVSHSIVRPHSVQSLLQEVSEIAVGVGGYVLAWGGVVDAATGDLRPSGVCGSRSGTIRELVIARDPSGENGDGIGGQALRSTAPTVCQDIASAAMGDAWRRLARESGIASVAYLPLVQQGEVVGLLAFYSHAASIFDRDELRLLESIAGEIAFAVQAIETRSRVDYLSMHDPVTDLPVADVLDAELEPLPVDPAAPDTLRAVAVLIDVQRVKLMNDAFGRAAVDTMMRELAERMRGIAAGERVRLLRRRSGPFVLLVEGHFESLAQIESAARAQVRSLFGEPFLMDGVPHHVSARCGIAAGPVHGRSVAALVARAESALMLTRSRGDRLLFYTDDMGADVARAVSLENELRVAMRRHQFELHYQPKISLADDRVVGVEALLRWNHPERGLQSPGGFIPILEATGMIADLGPWLIRQALSDLAQLRRRHRTALRVAVNISPLQMRRSDFVAMVAAELEGITPSECLLDIEITESMLIENAESAIEQLDQLRRLGIGIAIDDFGTGYSSLAYIARLPFQALKVDQSFVRTVADSNQSLAVAASIVSLATSLGKASIAEGVETLEQQETMRRLGCSQVQGFLHARPMPIPELIAWLDARGEPPEPALDQGGGR